MIGYFGFKGYLREYFGLYQAVSQREGERKDIHVYDRVIEERNHVQNNLHSHIL